MQKFPGESRGERETCDANSVKLLKRRRRRRKDSVVLPKSILESDDDSREARHYGGDFSLENNNISSYAEPGVKEEIGEPLSSSKNYEIIEIGNDQVIGNEDYDRKQCSLFSMTFPRYRVELTNSKNNPESERRRLRRIQSGIVRKLVTPRGDDSDIFNAKYRGDNTDKNGPWGFVNGLVQGVFNPRSFPANGRDGLNLIREKDSSFRKSLERLYIDEIKKGSFQIAKEWYSKADEGVSSTVDEDLLSAALFWRTAAEISDSAKMEKPPSERYLVLPGTTLSVAQNLCDILNWYADFLEKQRGDDYCSEGFRVLVRSELDTRTADIPVVHFTADVSGGESDREARQKQIIQKRMKLPTSDDTERRTKAWVKRVLVGLGICPFTKSNVKSGQGLGDMGVPVANIMYSYSEALADGGENDVYLLMADVWGAISDMISAGPSGKNGVSSILLSAPGFDDDFSLWAGPVFAMLESGVGAIEAEEMIGVVCFHPKYVTPDGKSWPGFGHMHSLVRLKKWCNEHTLEPHSNEIPLTDDEVAAGGAWQRRTPHAVINVLRAEQLEAAEGRRKTGELYARNVGVLVGKGGIGLDDLQSALENERSL
eukprot:CAMPEP_0171414600 /NCGR_PEP_ID=MMETSP0880-20121228/37778_1 /TAXON_ID=67004 /ORGANISM="Thalassiosira weissflogii, Strain CCMP1336" /LENGTH=597 /DNA_ID=CAMNT_0011932599 /DNA_START=138 /DNA_END=1931 /DNA_ORIENTATION=-